jgi:hypothetical protein
LRSSWKVQSSSISRTKFLMHYTWRV